MGGPKQRRTGHGYATFCAPRVFQYLFNFFFPRSLQPDTQSASRWQHFPPYRLRGGIFVVFLLFWQSTNVASLPLRPTTRTRSAGRRSASSCSYAESPNSYGVSDVLVVQASAFCSVRFFALSDVHTSLLWLLFYRLDTTRRSPVRHLTVPLSTLERYLSPRSPFLSRSRAKVANRSVARALAVRQRGRSRANRNYRTYRSHNIITY